MEYKCEFCSKIYASRQSRWNHIKNLHSKNVDQTLVNVSRSVSPKLVTVSQNNMYKCKYCKNEYKHRSSKSKHEKICKVTETNEIFELKKEIQELKDILQKSLKIHPKQLQKINNELQNSTQVNNQGTININNTNNIQVVQLAQLGDENLLEALSDKEKLYILNNKAHGLREMIKLVHISDKYKQFKNVYITNLQNTIGYKYDAKSNNFIAVNKNELLDELIDCRMFDIESLFNNYEDQLNPETAKIVKRFIDRMGDEKDPLKGVKKEEIKLLLYNSRDNIINGKKEIEL